MVEGLGFKGKGLGLGFALMNAFKRFQVAGLKKIQVDVIDTF